MSKTKLIRCSAQSAILLAISALPASLLGVEQGKVESQIQSKPEAASSLYGSFDLRHNNNYYPRTEESAARQQPSLQARLQLGYLAYNERVDFYTTLGVSKSPDSLTVQKRQPEFGADITLLKAAPFRVVQYSVVRLGGGEGDDGDSLPLSDRMPEYGTHPGPEVTIGLMPVLGDRAVLSGAVLRWKLGTDVSSFLYAKDTEVPPESIEQESEGDLTELKPEKDTVPRYRAVHQLSLGARFSAPVDLDLTAFYDNLYAPRYFLQDGNLSYRYVADRVSRLRLRFRLEMNAQVSFFNDLTAHYDELFGARAGNGGRPRYRNVAGISCLL